jgi:branched-chain amino acid transport system permease protein
MLLVHGSYASSRWWEPLFAQLPDEIYAVAPDLRGCGASEQTETGYRIAEQAADLWALVQALGWERFDLVAHSSGGAIAMEFALNHPNQLNTLILVDSVPIEGVTTPLDTIFVLEQLKTDQALLRQALALLMPTFNPTQPEHKQFFEQLVQDAADMAPAAFTAIAESLNHWNRFADAKQLTLPTLLLWGDEDTIVHRDGLTRTLIAIPGANNLEVLHGVGHSPMIEEPELLAIRILEFITQDFSEYEQVRAKAYAASEQP